MQCTASVHAQYSQAKGIVGRIAESLIRGQSTWYQNIAPRFRAILSNKHSLSFCALYRPYKTAVYSLAGNQKLLEGEVVAKIVDKRKGVERFLLYDDMADDIKTLSKNEQ